VFNSNKYNSGNGLGLSISKSFIEALGGKIWIKSELNIGTKVYFSLPQ
jgi:signal transduction histidine kinase